MQRSALDRLSEVLAIERTALLSADFPALAPLATMKEQLLQDLLQSPPANGELTDLRSKMQRNLDLTSAALRGVAAAQERISALETVRDKLTTYDQNGNVALVSQRRRTIERKA